MPPVRVRIEQPTYKAFAKIIALLMGSYTLTAADMQGGVIILIFEKGPTQ